MTWEWERDESNEAVACTSSLAAAGNDIDGNGDVDGNDGNDRGNLAGHGGLGRGQVVAVGLAEGHWRICQVG